MRPVAVGLLGLLSSVVSLPSPQTCCIPDPPCPLLNLELRDEDQEFQPCQDADDDIRVIAQRDNVPDNLEGFQCYPIPGGTIYIHCNPDVLIQPPPVLVKPPQMKPIQPPPIDVQPCPLPPINPPPLYVRPAAPKPINVPPICVKPKPLPPITPPPIVVKPPQLKSIQPPAFTIRQPELPLIRPPQIVVRQPIPPNLLPPTICFRTSILDKNPDNPPYPMSPC